MKRLTRWALPLAVLVLAGGWGAGTAQATPFCYQLVDPYSQCAQTQGPLLYTQVQADYDGANEANISVCARANSATSGTYFRDCRNNYISVYPGACYSVAIVGNNSAYRHTIKGESWYQGSGRYC